MRVLPHPAKFSGRIKRCLLTALCALVGLAATAQYQITVKDFKFDENEPLPSNFKEAAKDKNNQKCALIVIHKHDKTFRYETGGWNDSGKVTTNSQTKEVVNLLWVSPGTKWIEVRSTDSSIKPSERFQFGMPTESKKVYHLYLGDIVRKSSGGNQYVTISVDAPGAKLFVEEHPGQFIAWPLTDGKASKPLDLTTDGYNYRVEAPDYETDYGRFEVNDPDNAINVSIKLKPNFGFLTIPAAESLRNARIIIDGEIVGNSSLNALKLSAGNHTLQVERPKYKTLVREISIPKSQTVTERIALEENFSKITINCTDPEADIYLADNVRGDTKQATGTWMADLEPGSYVIKTRRPGCKEAFKQITIAPGNQPQEFSVPAPEPMYGSIQVSSSPAGARIYLDGKDMGVTPKVLNNQLAMTHALKLTYPGYQDYSTKIDLKEGQTAQLNPKMSNYITVQVDVEPRYATVYVDGMSANNPYTYQGPPTYKTIRASSWQRKGVEKRYHFTKNEKISIKLKEMLLHEDQWYLEAGMQVGMMPIGITVSTGFDLKWFNCQADFAYTFTGKKDTYFITEEPGYDSNVVYVNNSYCSFKPDMTMGGRVGVNIDCGTRFRLTPQFGVEYIHIGGEVDNIIFTGTPWALSCLGGLRCFLAISRNFGISLTPEYLFAVNRSDGYKLLCDIDSSYKNWANGFNCRIAAVINF